MQQQLASPWGVTEIAAQVSLGARQFERLFRAMMKHSPVQYWQGLRLVKAGELLRTTFLSGKQIAAQVGFNSERYFYREFKRAFGVSPRTYRQQQANEVSAAKCM